MKKLAFAALLALAIALCSCGSGTNTPVQITGAGGIWEAQLYGGTGEAALLDFTSQFSVGYNGGPLDITSFKFINSNSCFPPSVSTSDANSGESGSATLVTSASNQVTGSLTYNVAATGASGTADSLALTTTSTGVTGTSVNSALQNGVVIGTWSVTGDCTGSGSFVMCQEAVPNGNLGCGAAN